MKLSVSFASSAFVLTLCTLLGAADRPLEWAYSSHAQRGLNDRDEFGDPFNVIDWAPASHPRMPDIVAHGRRPTVMACGFCHLANGFGRPDNANLAGLPAAYIVQQMADYKNKQRRSTESHRRASSSMEMIARTASAADVQTAAEYFAAVVPRPWIRVVEVSSNTSLNDPNTDRPRREDEVIQASNGTRILEEPEMRRNTLREATLGFVAYVPTGVLKRGQALVTTGGGGRTVRCALCHGDDLRGTGSVPGIAGRSPSYLARQLNDMQQGSRFGSRPDRMMGTVARLTEAEIVSIVAYAASLTP